MAKKRANGEGSIRKRKDGRWEGRYTAGHDPNTGKTIYKNVLGKTQGEVKDINYMENYIKSKKPELLETFYELRGLDANGKKVELAAAATYGEIKMWFLTQFPEIEKLGKNVNKIIEEARKAREAQKEAA